MLMSIPTHEWYHRVGLKGRGSRVLESEIQPISIKCILPEKVLVGCCHSYVLTSIVGGFLLYYCVLIAGNKELAILELTV